MKILSILALLLSMSCEEAFALPDLNDNKQGCVVQEFCYEQVVYIKLCGHISAKFLATGKVATCPAPKSKN